MSTCIRRRSGSCPLASSEPSAWRASVAPFFDLAVELIEQNPVRSQPASLDSSALRRRATFSNRPGKHVLLKGDQRRFLGSVCLFPRRQLGGRLFRCHVHIDVTADCRREGRHEPIIIGLRNRIEFVIVTAGATHGQTQASRCPSWAAMSSRAS